MHIVTSAGDFSCLAAESLKPLVEGLKFKKGMEQLETYSVVHPSRIPVVEALVNSPQQHSPILVEPVMGTPTITP